MDLLAFDAYFFDFDGLLADTEPLHHKAYQIFLKRRGLILPWDFTTYCSFAHQPTEVFAKVMFDLFPSLKKESSDWMVLREEKQAIYQELIMQEPIPLMEGAADLLSYLSKHQKPLYVVTNATRRQVVAIRRHQPLLNIIPHWITREDYHASKPAPDGYLKALEQARELCGKTHCRGVGFEDTLRGITSLKGAHLTPVLIVPNNYPQPNPSALKDTYIFHSLKSLLPT